MRGLRTCGLGVAAAGVLLAGPGSAMAEQVFTADLNTLNAPFGSTASGNATLTLDRDADGDGTPMGNGLATLNVNMRVTGLEDLSDIDSPKAVHGAHVHGQFAANQGLPPAQQRDGPFFNFGQDNNLVDSVSPDQGDSDRIVPNDFVNFFEGLPDYGPVLLNLGEAQVPQSTIEDGEPPLSNLVQQVQAGNITPSDILPSGTVFDINTTYEFDLSTPQGQRTFTNLVGDDGQQLTKREIVVHGLTIPNDVSDAIDTAALGSADPDSFFAGVQVGPDQEFRITAPVASGEIQAQPEVVPTPSAVMGGMALLLGGGGLAYVRRRRQA